MNDTLRRTWPAVLVGVLALLYLWIGTVAHGWDRALGLGGGVLVLAAVATARRFATAAVALLVGGALPLAVATWWSIVTPTLAILVLLLGWIAIRHISQPPGNATPGGTASEPAP